MKEDTFQRVATYADRILFEEDRIVSANEIKSALGGGTDQVRQAHAAWMSGLADRLRRTESIPDLPPTFVKALVESWRDAVDKTREQAKAAWVEHERRANERIAASEQEVIALRAVLEIKEAELTAAQRVIDDTEAALRTQESALAAERVRVEAAERRVMACRETAEQAAQHAHAQIASLHEQLGLAHARQDALERRLVAQLDEQKTARLHLERQIAQKESAWAEAERARQVRSLALTESHAREQSEREALQKHVTVLNQRLVELEARHHHLTLERAVLTEKLDALNSTQQQLRAAFQTAQETIAQLQTELTEQRTEQRIWEQLTQIAKPTREE